MDRLRTAKLARRVSAMDGANQRWMREHRRTSSPQRSRKNPSEGMDARGTRPWMVEGRAASGTAAEGSLLRILALATLAHPCASQRRSSCRIQRSAPPSPRRRRKQKQPQRRFSANQDSPCEPELWVHDFARFRVHILTRRLSYDITVLSSRFCPGTRLRAWGLATAHSHADVDI